MSWGQIKFGDFITLQRGHDLTKEQFIPGEYPVVSSTTIMGYHNEYKAEAPGVVIGRSGTLGEVQYIDTNFWPHNTSLYVKDFKGNNPRFVYYFLKYFGTESSGGGSAVPTLNRNNLNVLDVNLPDVYLQKKISDILSVYDDLIENNQKQIKLLEEAAQRLYKEWFVALRFPGYENTPITDGVPQGWEKVFVTDLIEIKYGKDHKGLSDGEIPVYGSGGVMRKVDKIIHSGEAVLIPRKGSLNNIFHVTGDFWTIDTMFYSAPLKKNIMKYTYLFLKELDMYSFNIGAAVPSMTVKILDGISILLPTEILLEQFEKALSPMFEQKRVLTTQCDLAVQARDRLLPKLMSGELEV